MRKIHAVSSILISQMKSESRCFNSTKTLCSARKTYEGTPPDSDDIHIMMDIYGVENLIGPGVAPGSGNSICCEIGFYG